MLGYLKVSDERDKPLIKIDFGNSNNLGADSECISSLPKFIIHCSIPCAKGDWIGIALKFKPMHPNTSTFMPKLRSALTELCRGKPGRLAFVKFTLML